LDQWILFLQEGMILRPYFTTIIPHCHQQQTKIATPRTLIAA
jgi:hypothetical protein